MIRLLLACTLAALLPGAAFAQDAVLTSRDGALTIAGDLVSHDGEVYRLATRYGLLTVDAEGVICDGPACPTLTAPTARLRIAGAADPGLRLIPALLAAFAAARGYHHAAEATEAGLTARITDPATGQTLAEIAFAATPAALAALREGAADLALAVEVPPGMNGRALAQEALVPLVAAENRLPRLRSADLARALTGEAGNWAELGGPDMPIVLHGLSPDHPLSAAVAVRLGRPVAAAVVHDSPAALAEAVARDPWALALAGLSGAGPARVLPLTDSCDFPLTPSALGIKAGDYPLTATWHLVLPPRRMPLILRDFAEFLATDAAQAAVAAAGLTDRGPERMDLAADGRRLLGAIRNAGEEVSLTELQRLALAMQGTERLSLTFRFEGGSTQVDAVSQANLADLAALLAARAFDGYDLILAGFSDGSGAAAANLALSRSRAEAVRATLARLAPDLAEADLPAVEAYGEAQPIACDSTAAGRHTNRRVELWLRPQPAWDGPLPPPPDTVPVANDL